MTPRALQPRLGLPRDTDVAFRPLARRDLPLLHEWLQRPHVRAWWSEPSTLAELERDYFPADPADSTRAFIASLAGEPAGFVQSYVAMGAGDGWWEHETDPGVRGIDQFVADGALLGCGIGSSLARAFVATLFQDPAVTRVQADPSPANLRAIRCYQRAGFVPHGEVSTPDGPALLMHCHREPHGHSS